MSNSSGEVALVINTPDVEGTADSFSIRRTALDMRLPYCTTMAGAQAAVEGIRAPKTQQFTVKALQDYHLRSFENFSREGYLDRKSVWPTLSS